VHLGRAGFQHPASSLEIDGIEEVNPSYFRGTIPEKSAKLTVHEVETA